MDARHVNPCLYKFAHKYEDVSTTRDLFSQRDYLISFNLKSAYHHIEIYPEDRTFRGFEMEHKNYVVKVLPFCISTAGYVFTKVAREMVKHWRGNGLKILVYLDDGLGGGDTYAEAKVATEVVKSDLNKFGSIVAHEKCTWEPVQNLLWLGFTWHMAEGILRVSPDRIQKRNNSISNLLNYGRTNSNFIRVKTVASVVGQIISMKPVVGSQVRLITRSLYQSVLTMTS